MFLRPHPHPALSMLACCNKEHFARSSTSTQSSWWTRARGTMTISQMSHTGYNARDAWAAFNGFYHRAAKAALPANRPHLTKCAQIRARKQLKRQIHDDWERIKTDHRDDHVGLKLDLGHAIRMTTVAGRLVERAVREIERGKVMQLRSTKT